VYVEIRFVNVKEGLMTCAHPGCKCQEGTVQRSGKRFCSEACANAASTGSRSAGNKGGCGCGHAGCAS
jgi:hypothetical protein